MTTEKTTRRSLVLWYEQTGNQLIRRGCPMRSRLVYLLSFAAISFVLTMPQHLQAKSYIAYISDSTNSSVIYWIAKEAGILKKHGLDLDLIFINGSVRGIQSLIAGDLGYSGAVGTAVINAKIAG